MSDPKKGSFYKTGGWSRDFPFQADSRRYMLDGIPPGLWRRVRAKCKREGVSVRTKILTLLKAWVEEPSSEC